MYILVYLATRTKNVGKKQEDIINKNQTRLCMHDHVYIMFTYKYKIGYRKIGRFIIILAFQDKTLKISWL